MDPFNNLREQRELAAKINEVAGTHFANSDDGDRLAELVVALDEWRLTGGFDPYLTRALMVMERTFTWPDGEADEPDFDEPTFDFHVCDPDQWEELDSAVKIAAEFLTHKGITAPSSSPGPIGPGGWWSYVDGSYISNHYTGERTELSAHPYGFTTPEIEAINAIVNPPHTPKEG
jgi:hypothetical protein